MSTQNDDQWSITADIPLGLTHDERHHLLDEIQKALHGWLYWIDTHPEHAGRQWEPFLSAGAADHTWEAYADRLEKQLEQARQRLADAEERLHALRTAPRHSLRQPSAAAQYAADQARGQQP